MEQLYLNDLLLFDDYSNVKIKFNQFNGDTDPMDEYTKNPDTINNGWLFWRTVRRYFNVGESVICLLKVDYDIWLLTTIKSITKELNVENGINYEGDEILKYKPYFGRVLVKFHKDFTTQVRYAEDIINQFEVLQILPTIFDGDDFPGYEKVRLSFSQLETIISRNKKDWIAALENQKAVYLIRDTNNGKLYVGSATGENGMLLQRWKNYINNGHGGNKELNEIVNTQGFDYIKKYFQYSILENYNSRVDKKIILCRESWWKDTLGTRIPFGYNWN
ncbi:GIY-YIG nuclease family protein [Niameybacter massiliensis]|uniref:GIY-YIG nuclease family protein n=1 Tax=Niameybacter massiliensis TaxID=1658108 RepID=UPI0006B63160|nr:GIY-YIG nuclease family protein [Niameybacter massiliensis]